MQYDPALRELVFQRTGCREPEQVGGAAAALPVPVVARLARPGQSIEDLTVVARFGAIVTGRVPLSRLGQVRRHPDLLSLKAARGLGAALARSVPSIGAAPAAAAIAAGRGGRGVAVGVIDWGLDFAHANFRRPDGGTRLLALWDQRGPSTEDSPEPFGYGRELTRARIDAALSAADPYATLAYDPEDADADRSGTHGTHVADIAVGGGRAAGAAPGVAPEADLLFVHLAAADTAPEDTMGDSVRLLEAVRWTCDRAGDRPLAINLSCGQHGGPHDGCTLVERAFDAFLDEAPGRALVMSTGNYFAASVHAAPCLRPGEVASLPWHIPERDDDIAEMEIWYPGADELVFELLAPDGTTVARARLGEEVVARDGDRVLATVYHRRWDPNNGDHQIDVFVRAEAPAGIWTVRLHGANVRDGRAHAWIERTDPAAQSRFGPEVSSPESTTNTICNGHRTISVGAYDANAAGEPILAFSSQGPTRDGRPEPVLSAPGGHIRAARSSRLEDGVRTCDELTVKSGTSMAAPHVTGTVALMFEAAEPRRLAVRETQAILASAARPPMAAAGENTTRFGAGRVHAARSVSAVRALVAADARRNAPATPPLPPSPLFSLPVRRRPSRRNQPFAPEAVIMFEDWIETTQSPISTRGGSPTFTEADDAAEDCLDWLTGDTRQRLPGDAQERRTWPPRIVAETGTTIRKSCWNLSATEISDLLDGLNRFASTPQWWSWVAAHQRLSDSVHGTFSGLATAYQRFLPWHRLFLWEFEKILQTIKPGTFIPYWDWTVSGQRGLPDWTRRLPTAVTRPLGSSFPVSRNPPIANLSDSDSTLPTHAEIAALMSGRGGTDPRTGRIVTTDHYDTFTAVLENIHGAPHVWAGDTMANASVSPADFLFFMHHAQVDRVWRTWASAHPAERPSLSGSAASLERLGGASSPFTAVLDVRSLDFDYDRPWS